VPVPCTKERPWPRSKKSPNNSTSSRCSTPRSSRSCCRRSGAFRRPRRWPSRPCRERRGGGGGGRAPRGERRPARLPRPGRAREGRGQEGGARGDGARPEGGQRSGRRRDQGREGEDRQGRSGGDEEEARGAGR